MHQDPALLAVCAGQRAVPLHDERQSAEEAECLEAGAAGQGAEGRQ